MEYDVIDRSGVFISLNVKIPKGVSNKVRVLNTRYSKEVGVIVVNLLAHKGKNILYSRNTSTKMLPKKYNSKSISNRGLMNALDELEQKGYIVNNIAPRDYGYSTHDSISSSFTGTDLLYDVFSNKVNTDNSVKTIQEDTQRIVLKDKSKNMIDYKECDITEYSRKCLSTYNKYISQQHISYTDCEDITHDAVCCLTRIFNQEIGNTGRLYHSEIINIKSGYRESIQINGKNTIEIDFSNLHLRMLIDKYKCDKYVYGVVDLYTLPLSEQEKQNKHNREAVKKALNIILNNCKRHIACSAIQQYLNLENPNCSIRSANTLLTKIEEAYSFLPLQVILWQSKPLAYTLQRLDSDIALEIISAGVEDGVPVLPVHDSFIVTIDNTHWLQEMMGNTYRKHLHCDSGVHVSYSIGTDEYKIIV